MSIAPGIGVYVALRRLASPLAVALVAGLLLASASVGEAAAWGGYPQLLGLGLLPIVLVFVAQGAKHPRRSWLAGVGLLAIALTSDFVFAIAAASSILLLVLDWLLDRHPLKVLVGRVVRLTLPVVLATPLYVQIGLARLNAVRQPVQLLSAKPAGLASRIDAVWFDARLVWRALAILAIVGLPFLTHRRSDSHWRIALALCAVVAAALFAFPEPRIAYFVPTAVVVGVLLWSDEFPSIRGVSIFAVGLAACVVLQFAAVKSTSTRQVRRYQALTPALVRGIDWVRTSTPKSSVLVVTPYREAPPVGWWLEGLGERRTLSASSFEWIYFSSERENARRAARVLAAGVPTERTLNLAKRFGADFVFIDKRWNEYKVGRVTNLERAFASVVAYENSGVVILRTDIGSAKQPEMDK